MGQVTLTGIVLLAAEVGDYDRRLVIITRERGKITAFAKGARKPGNSFVAAAQPFTYGRFNLYEGRDAYRLNAVEVENYFTNVKNDFEAIMYATYFSEMVEHLTMENAEARDLMKLLYITLRALENRKIPKRLVRCIFEVRAMSIDGERMQVFECMQCHKEEDLTRFYAKGGGVICRKCINEQTKQKKDQGFILNSQINSNGIEIQNSTIYALQYILTVPFEKMYNFLVSPEVLAELEQVSTAFLKQYFNDSLKSLEFLKSLS